MMIALSHNILWWFVAQQITNTLVLMSCAVNPLLTDAIITQTEANIYFIFKTFHVNVKIIFDHQARIYR